MSLSRALSTNNYGPAKLIVSTSAANGTHTTLAAALAAASAGDTIFLRDSVTENVTITPGVNIAGWQGSSLNTPSITGKLTMTGAGTSTISGIKLVTNSDFVIAVTGSAASVLNINNCYLNCTNNTGISYTTSSPSSSISFNNCSGDLGTTGITLFVSTSAGTLGFVNCIIGNSGLSSTQSTISTGVLNVGSTTLTFPISLTSTALGTLTDSTFIPQTNSTAYTQNIAGAINCDRCVFNSGSASAIVITAGTLSVRNIVVNSSNTNAITGAGALLYGLITYTGTSSVCNVTSQAVKAIQGASTVAYTPVCGGITANGVLQSVASTGTSGQVFTSNGNAALPTFQTPAASGSWTLIQTLTASSSANLSFTTGITSTYNSYVLILRQLVPQTNGVSFNMVVSTNGGSSYLNSGYLGFSQTLGSSGTGTRASTTTIPIEGTASNISNSTTYGFNGIIYMNNVTSGTNSCGVELECTYTNGTPIAFTALGGGFCPVSSVINAIQFAFSSGNINSGTISLYGISQ